MQDLIEAVGPAAETLTDSVLGALVVILLGAAGYLIRQLLRAKNDHLADKDQMQARLLLQANETSKLLQETNKAVWSLARAVESNTSALGHVADCTERVGLRVEAHALSCPQLDQAKYLVAKGGGR